MGDNFKPEAYEGAKAIVQNPDHKWMKFVNTMLDELDPNVAKMTALNLGFEAAFYGTKTIRKIRDAVFMPTSENLSAICSPATSGK